MRANSLKQYSEECACGTCNSSTKSGSKMETSCHNRSPLQGWYTCQLDGVVGDLLTTKFQETATVYFDGNGRNDVQGLSIVDGNPAFPVEYACTYDENLNTHSAIVTCTRTDPSGITPGLQFYLGYGETADIITLMPLPNASNPPPFNKMQVVGQGYR